MEQQPQELGVLLRRYSEMQEGFLGRFLSHLLEACVEYEETQIQERQKAEHVLHDLGVQSFLLQEQRLLLQQQRLFLQKKRAPQFF
jgi:hypothetical protein